MVDLWGPQDRALNRLADVARMAQEQGRFESQNALAQKQFGIQSDANRRAQAQEDRRLKQFQQEQKKFQQAEEKDQLLTIKALFDPIVDIKDDNEARDSYDAAINIYKSIYPNDDMSDVPAKWDSKAKNQIKTLRTALRSLTGESQAAKTAALEHKRALEKIKLQNKGKIDAKSKTKKDTTSFYAKEDYKALQKEKAEIKKALRSRTDDIGRPLSDEQMAAMKSAIFDIDEQLKQMKSKKTDKKPKGNDAIELYNDLKAKYGNNIDVNRIIEEVRAKFPGFVPPEEDYVNSLIDGYLQ